MAINNKNAKQGCFGLEIPNKDLMVHLFWPPIIFDCIYDRLLSNSSLGSYIIEVCDF